MTAPDPLFLTAPLLYGPVPGVEFIPLFLGLLTWVGVALAAVFLAPIRALIRRLRNLRGKNSAEPLRDNTMAVPGSEPLPASVPESPDEGRRDRV